MTYQINLLKTANQGKSNDGIFDLVNSREQQYNNNIELAYKNALKSGAHICKKILWISIE